MSIIAKRGAMQILKRIGPSTDPWGIPCSRGISRDLLSSIDTQLFLSIIYDVSQSRAIPVKPALAKRLINIEWLSVSKAVECFY